MGWAFLPPIQRQLAEPIRPLSRGFEPGAWASPMFTGAMTHAVADGAPHGLIDGDGRGLGTPIQRSAAGPELTLLPPPRPRAQRSIQRATDAEVAEIDAASDAPPPETWSTDDSAGGADGGSGGGAETPVTVARLAASGAPAAVPEPPRSLVRASPVGLPFVQRAAIAEPASAPAVAHEHADEHQHAHESATSGPAAPAAAEPTFPVTSTLAPGAPAAEPLGGAGPPSAMPSTSAAALPIQRMSSAATATGRPVAGERPRLGFGAPMSQVPLTAQGSPPDDLPGPALQAQRAGDNGFTEVSLPGVGAGEPTPRPTPRPAPGMPLQRASAPDAPPMEVAAVAAESSAEPAEHAEPAEPAEPAEAIHPEDCADPGHGHPAASPTVVASAGPPDVVPATEAEVPISPTMRGDVAPLHVGGLNTSIQRSSVLPGPGLPLQRLAVRPAGVPTPPAARVVRVQRVPSAIPSASSAPTAPSTPSSSASLAPSTPSSAPPAPAPSTSSFPAQFAAPTAAADTVDPPPSLVDAAQGAAPSPLSAAAVIPAYDVPATPVLQRSTTTGGPLSVPARASVAPGSLARADAMPVAVEYATIPLAVDRATSPPVSDGAVPGSFLQRSAVSMPSAPALRAPDRVAPPALVLPQRASAAEVADTQPAMVQRAEMEEPAPEPEVTPPAADAGATGSTAAAPAAPAAAGGAQSPEQAEAMARQLFPSLLRMLRGEMVVDRERRGVRTDRW
ncbi:hypothetical protein [Nocardioides sp. WS12]|uniref:hypothetical protein n=1 Tax=Nocardioides sp. WS12 TaxID=2486272 RepID=UPI0015FE035A|nr:hypothetical protein [Nocardioides sp. WS12]